MRSLRIRSNDLWGAWLGGLLVVLCAPAQAAGGFSFFHKDWELACDNTRTCRAAGYSPDNGEPPIGVLLTRKAGAPAEVIGEVQTGSYADKPHCPEQLRMQGVACKDEVIRVGESCSGVLSGPQIEFLLNSARKKSAVVFADGARQWALSLDGAQAVLLKMDEAQGRLNTPTALVRKGSQPASRALPPLPVPVIRVPQLPAIQPGDEKRLAAILPVLKATLGKENNCPMLLEPVDGEPQETAHLEARLSPNQLLVSHRCWRGAYNEGLGYWVVQDRPPHKAVLVTDMGGGYADGYEKGEISYSHKGRGLGDCWGSGAWAWNGKAFVVSQESSTGMCRLIAPGGAWNLPTTISTVVHEKQTRK